MTDIDALLDTHDTMGLAELVATGEVTSRELVDASIDRIDQRDPVLNAVVFRRFDEARAEATEFDRTAGHRGALAGVPFLVKDLNCDVAGLPATRGSRLFAGVVAESDSELTTRFRAAGLIILGSTNTPEMGKNASTESQLHGPCHNPWELGHSTGGSSGGSAAAVASGMVTAAHANDGGGSIRIPASACGLVGLKPTRGRTPTWPIPAAFSYPLGIGHAVTRTVRDSAAILDALVGPVPGDPYPQPAPPTHGTFLAALAHTPGAQRIGFATVAANGQPADPDCAAAVERTAAVLASLGHRVDQVSPTFDQSVVASVVTTIMGAAGADAVETFCAQRGAPLADHELEPLSRFIHDRMLASSAVDLVRALQQVEIISRSVAGFFADRDIWLTPTIGPLVPPLGHLDTTDLEAMFSRGGRFSEWTAVFNVTGQPAISVPAGLNREGLPIGVQLVGAHGTEELLLQLAAQLEQAAPWPSLAPWPPA